MKYLILTLLLGCGGRTEVYHHTTEVPVREPSVVETQLWEGTYYFEHGSCLDFIENEKGEVYIGQGCSELVVDNIDNSLGELPELKIGSITPKNASLSVSKVLKYHKHQNRVTDDLGAVIEGNRRTEYEVKLEDGKIYMNVKIYGPDESNEVVTTRTFEGY